MDWRVWAAAIQATCLDIDLKAAANSKLTGNANVMTLLSSGKIGINDNAASAALASPATSRPTAPCAQRSDSRLRQHRVDRR